MSRRVVKFTVVVCLMIGFLVHVLPVQAQIIPELKYKESELIVRFAPKDNKGIRTKSEMNNILSSIVRWSNKKNKQTGAGINIGEVATRKKGG